MTIAPAFLGYTARLRQFMAQTGAHETAESKPWMEERFSGLALELFALQFDGNPVYRKLCEAGGLSPRAVSHWEHIPAVPIGAFKEFELTSLTEAQRTTVFHSSGTTGHRPSRHFHNATSLALYEASLLSWFQSHMLPELDAVWQNGLSEGDGRPVFVILTPPAAQAPHSSLVHMFETVRREFGAPASMFGGSIEPDGAWSLHLGPIDEALQASIRANRPAVLLGTAFNFVHLLEHQIAQKQRYKLPVGSRVLETGGYKGRSRAFPKVELRALIAEYLGIPLSHIIGEYGMSELSSQAYDAVAGKTGDAENGIRTFRFPPWTRVRIVSPETGVDAPEGEAGLVRLLDLANVSSVLAIQTDDVGMRRGYEFELVGRGPTAEPRGCSLMAL